MILQPIAPGRSLLYYLGFSTAPSFPPSCWSLSLFSLVEKKNHIISFFLFLQRLLFVEKEERESNEQTDKRGQGNRGIKGECKQRGENTMKRATKEVKEIRRIQHDKIFERSKDDRLLSN